MTTPVTPSASASVGAPAPRAVGDRSARRWLDVDARNVVHSWTAQEAYEPRLVTAAAGATFTDSDGREYLDFTSQAWYANIGHGNARVAAAVAEQARELATVYRHGTVPKLRLTERLLSLLPGRYDRVFFGCNGSDAVEIALKVARLVTGRQNVVSFYGEYHGASMGATSITGQTPWRTHVGQPVPGTVFTPPPYRGGSPFGPLTRPQADDLALALLRHAVEQTGPDTVAAVVGEPIVTGGPPVVPGRSYWRRVRELCDEFGLLLVADEVVTGFGRTGHWFARDHYDFLPDVICLAKGLTSGYLPLSAAVFDTGVSARFAGRLLPHGLTWSGHPVCCAAALANVDVIEEDGLVPRAAAAGRRLATGLARLAGAHPNVARAESLGLFGTLELTGDTAGNSGEAVMRWMEADGVVVRGAGRFVSLAPPLVVSWAELERGLDSLDRALSATPVPGPE